ncbi:MAG: hypothetical protein U0625_10110 [Phycisphaerales bacterium]
MPRLSERIRALFLGTEPRTPEARRATPERVDAERSTPVPADSQEIVSMARDFRSFLDQQDQRQAELARVVATLPQTMGALPELVRQQTRLADLIAQQLMYSRQRDEQVEKTLARITQGVEQQRDVISLVQQQLDLNHESAMRVAEGVSTLSSAVVQLQSTTDRSAAALQGLLDKTTERDAEVQRQQTRLQNWMLFLAILQCAALAGALILVWIALELRVTPAPAAPPADPRTAAGAPSGETGAGGATGADSGDAATPAAPPPTGTAVPALGGQPQPTTGGGVPAATGGGAVPR